MFLLRKLNRIFDRETKVKLLVLLVLITFGGFLEFVVLSLISPFISVLLDNTIIYTSPQLNWVFEFLGIRSIPAFLAIIAIAIAAVYVFRGIYIYTLNKIMFRFVGYRQAKLCVQLLNKIMGYSYLHHTHRNVAEFNRIINGDVYAMFTMIKSILAILSDIATTIFILAFLIIMSPLMTLFVLILSLTCAAIYFMIFRKKIGKLGERSRTESIAMTKTALQAISGIKEIKILRRHVYFSDKYKERTEKFAGADSRFQTINAAPPLMIGGVCFGGAFIMLAVALLIGADIGAMTPQLAMFVLAAFRLLPAIANQVMHINALLNNRVSADAVYKTLFEEEDIATPVKSDLSAPESGSKGEITISNLSFKYPAIDEAVLEDVSLTICANESVAFVGTSGAGKTTLVDLILGVLTPDEGGVFSEGISIHANPDMWSKRVGYIPQVIYLTDESVLENVAFGIDPELVDEDKVWNALEQAHLREFVEGLPDGINTIVGDRGVRLSGGQRQRIGIARALYNDPPILVLDEATSSLDHETERAIIESIKGFHGNKTVIIVAHRLTTIEHCDIVYRVEDKKVVRER